MSDERIGALTSAAWSAAITVSADPSRFRRGREYLRENAVIGLEVHRGQLIGSVLGSRASAYEISIGVPVLTGPAPASVAQLVPAGRDLRFQCSCPDWDEPCKHAVAVALAFGERLRFAPEELAELRGVGVGDLGQTPPAAPASVPTGRSGRTERHLSVVSSLQRTEEVPPVSAEVLAFLGVGSDLPTDLPDLPVLPLAAPAVGAVAVSDVVADAISWLAVAYPTR